jgi:hypothetical protein
MITIDVSCHRSALRALAASAPDVATLESTQGSAWLSAAATRLPDDLLECLRRFSRESANQGALLIRGIPVDPDLPPTPTARTNPRYVNHTAAALTGACASWFGEIFGYAQLDSGAVFRSVSPLASEAQEQSSKSSAVPLLLHTEQTFHPYRPRHLVLHCLRGAPGASTVVVTAADVWRALSPADRQRLSRPAVCTGIDYAFGNLSTTKGNACRLAVFGAGDVFSVDEDLMVAEDTETAQALNRLWKVLADQAMSICLDAGDLLVIDNHRAAHGRTPFAARFDGTDRWLMQVKTLLALPPPGPDRAAGTRVITTVDFGLRTS